MGHFNLKCFKCVYSIVQALPFSILVARSIGYQTIRLILRFRARTVRIRSHGESESRVPARESARPWRFILQPVWSKPPLTTEPRGTY